VEIEQIHRDYSRSHKQKLMGYYQLKSMLGPLIEGLILLDRLQFMLEQVSFLNVAYLNIFPLANLPTSEIFAHIQENCALPSTVRFSARFCHPHKSLLYSFDMAN